MVNLTSLKKGDFFDIYSSFDRIALKAKFEGITSGRLYYKDFTTNELFNVDVSRIHRIVKRDIPINHIYIITNISNGKQYIGRCTCSTKKRLSSHISATKYKWNNSLLAQAIREYGKDNFIIEELFSFREIYQHRANVVEQHFIKKYNTSYPNGYNMIVTRG